jgi:hypothetical protein
LLILKNHCVFIPDKREEGERFIYVIDLTNKNSIFKIRDFTGDESFVHATFLKYKIFIASTNKFKMVDLS